MLKLYVAEGRKLWRAHYRMRNQNHVGLRTGPVMTASVTLIVVGVFLLAGGDWPPAYAIACIAIGALAWHLLAHARTKAGVTESAPARFAATCKALGVIAGVADVAAVLVAGAYAFDHPETGLFSGFSREAVLGCFGYGGGLLVASWRLKLLRARLNAGGLAGSWRGAPGNT